MSKPTKQDVSECTEAIKRLLAQAPVTQGKRTIYAIVSHVSASGMQRQIKLYVADKDGSLNWLTGYASRLLGWSIGKQNGVKVDGCGMDMCFHLVDTVMHSLGTESRDWQKSYRVETL